MLGPADKKSKTDKKHEKEYLLLCSPVTERPSEACAICLGSDLELGSSRSHS